MLYLFLCVVIAALFFTIMAERDNSSSVTTKINDMDNRLCDQLYELESRVDDMDCKYEELSEKLDAKFEVLQSAIESTIEVVSEINNDLGEVRMK